VILDRAALADQYRPDRINRDDVWDLVARTQVVHDPDFDQGDAGYTTRVSVTTRNGDTRTKVIEKPRGGLGNPLSDEEIVAKYRTLTEHVVGHSRRDEIQEAVLAMEDSPHAPRDLQALLAAPVNNILA
jgi:aconitate decarboxylase